VAKREQPITQAVKASEAKQHWEVILDQVRKAEKRVLVEKNGTTVAAIISAEDFDRLQRWQARRDQDFAILDEIGEAFKDESPEEIERQVSRALATVRAKNRHRFLTRG
jgi:prevent-host-death family protein